MSRSQAGIVCSADRSKPSWLMSSMQVPSPFQDPCPHHHSSRLVSQVCRRCTPGRDARSPHQQLTALLVCAFSSSLALPAFFQYVSINLLHLQTLHLTKDAQGSGAGEGMVRGVAASGKEGIMKKIENKY